MRGNAAKETKEGPMSQEKAPSVVCLGFVDGVHLGHLALIEAAKEAAREKGLKICVHTFDQPPGQKKAALTSLEEREALLKNAGADEIAVSIFDDNMRHMPGEEFFQKIVVEKLNARHIICGDDHRFGYMGACGVKELQEMCRENGIGLTIVSPVTLDNGMRISSTAIRRALQEGNLELAEKMLGRKPAASAMPKKE